jgi:putative Holliday junction resolvase
MIIGVDPGERRVGVALADAETRFARPLEVIDARDRDPVERVAELVREVEASLVVVGQPMSLSGRSGAAVEAQRGFVKRLRAAISVQVTEFDERLTTVVADSGLRAAGAPRRARARIRDAVAAQIMLQGYLDSTG